jgi:hypothetical protein
MTSQLRRSLLGVMATAPLWNVSAFAQTTTLKISHQFPGGTITEGDFRDRLTRVFAQEAHQRRSEV